MQHLAGLDAGLASASPPQRTTKVLPARLSKGGPGELKAVTKQLQTQQAERQSALLPREQLQRASKDINWQQREAASRFGVTDVSTFSSSDVCVPCTG